MIKVYQIQLTNSEVAQLNREGWEADNLRIRAYGRRSFIKPDEVDMQFYDHVANVLTDDREDAFQLMNLWEEESKVERLGPCSSMSVGDVVEMENGTRYLCASFGFKEI